jgi:ribosomal protein RSM22 (predicted rRNA methylase)
MPATYAAAEAVLREIKLRLGDQEIASVLDVGAGTGAAALAAQECFAPSRITLLERTPAMAAVARTFLPEADIRMDDFARPESFPPHDLVIAAYALGETGALDALPRLWRAARVALVVIEPGSPAGFAFVREVRSRLMGDGGHMVAPCPTEGPCPVGEGDWCHFAARVERTGLHRRLKNAELNYEDEKFSYVAVARDTVTPAPGRIVRRPVHQPGLIVLETCTTRGIETVQARKRDRDVFRAARRAGWGEAWEQKND